MIQALASICDPSHYRLSIGEIDLVPIVEEYSQLLQFSDSSNNIYVPTQGYRANKFLEKVFGLTHDVVKREVCKEDTTWRKANISHDFLTVHFSRSQCSMNLLGDFSDGDDGWIAFRVTAFKISFACIILFPSTVDRIDLGVVPLISCLSTDISIVSTIISETVRLLSYCQSHGEGIPTFYVHLF